MLSRGQLLVQLSQTRGQGSTEYQIKGNSIVSRASDKSYNNANDLTCYDSDTFTSDDEQVNRDTSDKTHTISDSNEESLDYKGMKKTDAKWDYCVDRAGRILTPSGCLKRCEKSQIKHCSKFSEAERQAVFSDFWEKMDWGQKKVYISSPVKTKPTERKTTVAQSRRSVSYEYFIRKNDQRLSVCKKMFLSTLGVGERAVYEWIKNSDSAPEVLDSISRKSEARKERDVELRFKVAEYLDSLPKMESHYCRASTRKLYLEPVFSSFSEVYNAYKEFCKENSLRTASYTLLKNVFDDRNLSLFSPKKDQCDVCCAFETGNIAEEEYNIHISRKESARNEKQKDKELCMEDGSYRVFTLDLQSVLLCPRLQASAMYYKTKLACHNFTIFDLKTKDVDCYFWTEVEGALTASSFASCIVHYIEHILIDGTVKHVVLYSDGCTYQNRNVTLSNALLKIAQDKGVTITQKILEKGHTQMEVDSVHSVIERKLKRKPIYIPNDYVEIIRNARPSHPYKINYLKFSFFQDYTGLQYYSSIRPGTRVGDHVVTDIGVLQYSPDGNIMYKLMYEDNLQELPRKAKKQTTSEIDGHVRSLHTGRLPITDTKFAHLQALKNVIPQDYHTFYDTLVHK